MLKKIGLLLIFTALLASGLSAQQAASPAYLWVRGDLYRLDPDALTTEPLTATGTVSNPVIAPDGARIAYRQASPLGLEALDRVQAEGEIAEIDLPSDIVILDLVSGAMSTIAAQPADASLFVAGIADKAIVRSAPAWSPDGTRLAWTEFDFGVEVPRLMIYDLAAATTTVLLPAISTPITQGRSPEIRWGEGVFIINLSADAAGEQSYLMVSEAGTMTAAPRIGAVTDDYVLDFYAVQGANQTYAGLFYASGRWTILDTQTGVGVPFPDVPHLVSRAAGESSLRVRFDITPDMGMFWEVLNTTMAFTGAPARVTLSPDGQALAFIGYPTFNGAAIWRNEAITEIPNTGETDDVFEVGAVLWGATEWTIDLP